MLCVTYFFFNCFLMGYMLFVWIIGVIFFVICWPWLSLNDPCMYIVSVEWIQYYSLCYAATKGIATKKNFAKCFASSFEKYECAKFLTFENSLVRKIVLILSFAKCFVSLAKRETLILFWNITLLFIVQFQTKYFQLSDLAKKSFIL